MPKILLVPQVIYDCNECPNRMMTSYCMPDGAYHILYGCKIGDVKPHYLSTIPEDCPLEEYEKEV